MTIVRRAYTSQPGFTPDFERVRQFLLRINSPEVTTVGFLWARWEWAFSLPYQDETVLDRIQLWEDDATGDIVAIATYELELGDAYLAFDPRYRADLMGPVFDAAMEYLAAPNGRIRVIVPDTAIDLQEVAFARGFRPTQDYEANSRLPIATTDLSWSLPNGFRIAESPPLTDAEWEAYALLFWRGFDHEVTEGPMPVEREVARVKAASSGPHFESSLKVSILAPNGDYAAHCGMWHEPGTSYALVEPVCTAPKYRRLGLARAAVLEGVRRCAERGAGTAYVGARFPIYYAVGFRPMPNDTWWERPSPRTA